MVASAPYPVFARPGAGDTPGRDAPSRSTQPTQSIEPGCAARRYACGPDDELITTQRVALVVHHLGCLGEVLTTRQVANLVGLSYHGARKMLEKISGARSHDGVGIPLVELEGRWMYMVAG